jgi:hypothetical protein
MKQTTSTLFLALLMAVPLVHADDTLVMKQLFAKATPGDVRDQVSLAVRYRDGRGDKQNSAD